MKNLFLVVFFCAPLYLIKFTLFTLPFNVLELLAILAVAGALALKDNRFFAKAAALPKSLALASGLLLVGLLLSILLNDNYQAGFGIFKGWFLIPMFFSLALFSVTDSIAFLEKIFKTIFFSSALVGTISLGYKILGFTTYDGRLTAFYQSPNHLAMYLAPGIFFGFYFLKASFSQKKLALHFSLIILIAAPLYYTYSYGAWLALLIALLLTLLSNSNQRRTLIKFGWLFFLVVLILFASQVGSRKFSDLLNSAERSSLSSRFTIWRVATRLIAQSPIVGIGPGNFQAAYLDAQKYYPPYLEWASPQPHNIFLAFWLQTGIIGLTSFLGLLFLAFKKLSYLLTNIKSAALAAPLLGFFLYLILHGLSDTTYWKNDLALIFWVCLATVFSLSKFTQQKIMS